MLQSKDMLARSDAQELVHKAGAWVASITGNEMNPVLVVKDCGRRYHISVRLPRDMQDLDKPITQEFVDVHLSLIHSACCIISLNSFRNF